MAYKYKTGTYSAGFYPKDSDLQRKIGARLYYQITETATTYKIDVYGQCTISNDKLTMTVDGKLNLTGKTQVTGHRNYSYSAVSSNRTGVYYTICSSSSSPLSRTWTKTTSTQSATASMKAYWDGHESTYFSTASQPFTIPALAKYTISYDANGGTGAPAADTKWYDQAYTVSSTKPTRAGYTFQNWKISQTGNTVNAGGTISANSNSNYTLVAQWTPNPYNVVYNANGGTGSMENSTFTYDVSGNLRANTFTRTDYLFTGWATSATGGVVYNDGASVKNLSTSANYPLYAVWTEQFTKPNLQFPLAWRRGDYIEGEGFLEDDTGNNAELQVYIIPARKKLDLAGTEEYVKTYVTAAYKDTNSTTDNYINIEPTNPPQFATEPTTLSWKITNNALTTEGQYDILFTATPADTVDGQEVVKTNITSSISTFISTAEFALDINADGSSFGLFSVAPGTYVEEVDETDNQTTVNRVKTVSINGDLLLAIDEHAGEGHIDDTLLKLLNGLSWNVTVNPQDVVQTSSETESGTETNTDTNNGE